MNARECALRILYQIETQLPYTNVAVDDIVFKSLHMTLDKNFCIQIVYGVIRRQNTLDHIIRKFINSPERFHQMNKWLLVILRMGIYQICYLDKVPHYSAVDESVKLAKTFVPIGGAKFINAVLRRVCENQTLVMKFEDVPDDERLALRLSHPAWLIKRWAQTRTEAAAIELCEANNLPPPLTVRANLTLTTRAALQEALQSFGAEPTTVAPECLRLRHTVDFATLPAFQEGLFYVQDEAAMLVTHILDPKPLEVIIDLCAAPGGKTTHIAEMTGCQALILAYDRYSHRVQKIKNNARRLHLTGINVRVQDMLRSPEQRVAHRVLLDAPCTGTGVIRRHPEIKWRLREKAVAELSEIQSQLMDVAAKLVAPNGVLVYSVCSIEPEETRDVVSRFLVEHPAFALAAFPDAALEMVKGLKDSASAASGTLTLDAARHGTDGFFVAHFRRKGAA